MTNRSSRELPAPRWNPAVVHQRLRDEGFEGKLPTVAWFGDTADQANELADLVRQGRKRATAGLLWRWEGKGGPPKAGDRQVILDWQGVPRAVIEMIDVRIVPFDEVHGGFAREEGEGDLSLDHWRRVHWSFFTRECDRLGRDPSRTMPVVCMRFRLVHPASR